MNRGNSSRTIAALQERGVKTVFLDITRFGGQNVTPEQWYLGLRSEFLAYWKANAEFSFVQRFFGALGEVALEKLTEPIVVFVDEIDAALLEEEGKPFGSQTPLSTLAFSPDKARFVTGGTDQIVRLWDASWGRLRHELPGNRYPIRNLAFSPDSTRIASAAFPENAPKSSSGAATVWEVDAGKLTWSADYYSPRSVCWSKDGKLLYTGSTGGVVVTWDLTTGNLAKMIAAGTTGPPPS